MSDEKSLALERFLRYVTVETTSHEGVASIPSTPCQFDLAKLLTGELERLGLTDIELDEHCYLMATLPSNLPGNKMPPVMGLLAHLDTSDASPGLNVKPKVMEYKGGDILLCDGVTIPESEGLRRNLGQRIVVTDGTTLLGGDDKAGIAAIMTALERMIHQKLPHGTIRVAFTPDEEIGRGADLFDLKKFGADLAYTVDGGPFAEINCETFNADQAEMTVIGHDIHPGYANGVMVNAAKIVANIISRLPITRSPEWTDQRKPFIHLLESQGNVSRAQASFILRAFDEKDRRANMDILENTFHDVLNSQRGATGTLEIRSQYSNMKKYLDEFPQVTELLEKAVRLSGIDPKWVAIRGGTDGSRLSEMGLPTPNLFAGYYNPHARTEWLSVNELELTVNIIVRLASLWSEEDKSVFDRNDK